MLIVDLFARMCLVVYVQVNLLRCFSYDLFLNDFSDGMFIVGLFARMSLVAHVQVNL
jgi:hypothetical protein